MRGMGLAAAAMAAALAFATGAAAQENADHATYEAALDAAVAKYPLKEVLIGIAVAMHSLGSRRAASR
jgi:pectin methylesterase-like acyl-CoA thioesterase